MSIATPERTATLISPAEASNGDASNGESYDGKPSVDKPDGDKPETELKKNEAEIQRLQEKIKNLKTTIDKIKTLNNLKDSPVKDFKNLNSNLDKLKKRLSSVESEITAKLGSGQVISDRDLEELKRLQNQTEAETIKEEINKEERIALRTSLVMAKALQDNAEKDMRVDGGPKNFEEAIQHRIDQFYKNPKDSENQVEKSKLYALIKKIIRTIIGISISDRHIDRKVLNSKGFKAIFESVRTGQLRVEDIERVMEEAQAANGVTNSSNLEKAVEDQISSYNQPEPNISKESNVDDSITPDGGDNESGPDVLDPAHTDLQVKELTNNFTSYDSAAVRVRMALVQDILNEHLSNASPFSHVDEKSIDLIFESNYLTLPEELNPSIVRIMQDARYLQEAYKTIVRERNEEFSIIIKNDDKAIKDSIESINVIRRKSGKDEIDLEAYKVQVTKSDGSTSQEIDTNKLKADIEDTKRNILELSREESELIQEAREKAAITHYLKRLKAGIDVTDDKLEGVEVTDAELEGVSLRIENGYPCLEFDNKQRMFDIVDVKKGKDIKAAVSKYHDVILIHNDGGTDFDATLEHELEHLRSRRELDVQSHLVRSLAANKALDALYKHKKLPKQNTDRAIQQVESGDSVEGQNIPEVVKIKHNPELVKLVEQLLTGDTNIEDALKNAYEYDTYGLESKDELESIITVIIEGRDYKFESKVEEKVVTEGKVGGEEKEREVKAEEKVVEVDRILKIKLSALSTHVSNEERKAIELDIVTRRKRLQELRTRMRNEYLQKGRLTLSSFGYDKDNKERRYSTIYPQVKSNDYTRATINENAYESLNLLRLLNSALALNKEKVGAHKVNEWINRIGLTDQVSTENLLAFIYDMVVFDNLILEESEEINNPYAQTYYEEGEKVLRIKENIRAHAAKRIKDEITSEVLASSDYETKIKHLKSAKAKEDLLQELVNEKFKDRKHELDESVNQTLRVYYSLLNQGFEPKDDEFGVALELGNEKFDYAEPVDIRGLVGVLDKEGYVKHSFSKVESPLLGGAPIVGDLITTILSESGLKPRDLAELGFIKDTRKINRWRLLPFGLGETKLGEWIAKKLGLLKESDQDNLRRLAANQVTRLEMKSIYDIYWTELIDGMIKQAQIQQNHALLLASERIGILYFDGEQNQPGVYTALEQLDEYYDANLYHQISDPNGKIRKSLMARGYSIAEIDRFAEAFNPEQMMGSVNASEKGIPLKLGTVTNHWVKSAKMMRIHSVYTDKGELGRGSDQDFINQGKTFDNIGDAVMALQIAAHDNGSQYSLRNVIDEINSIEARKPGNYGRLDDEGDKKGWRGKRDTINLNGQDFALEDVKDFVQSFIMARTYESTATGLYGKKEVFLVNGKVYSVKPGTYSMDENEKIHLINTAIKESTTRVNEESYKLTESMLTRNLETLNTEFEDIKIRFNTATSDADREAVLVELGNKQKEINDVLTQKENLKNSIDPRYMLAQMQQYFTLIEVGGEELENLSETFKKELFGEGPERNKFHELVSHRDFDAPIMIKSPQGFGYRQINRFEGINKKIHYENFREPKPNVEGSTDENNFTLPDRSGYMTNAVQDVIVERTKVLELYFAHQIQLVQAAKYKGEASKQKERWIGFARLDQYARWTVTIALLLAIFTSFGATPFAAKFLLNPYTIGALLADYFFISNRLTRVHEMWSKRKIAAIKSEEQLHNIEAQFEQALSNPRFSSTRGRKRLEYAVKSAEDVLKQSALVKDSIDMPSNRIQGMTEEVFDFGKSVVTKS